MQNAALAFGRRPGRPRARPPPATAAARRPPPGRRRRHHPRRRRYTPPAPAPRRPSPNPVVARGRSPHDAKCSIPVGSTLSVGAVRHQVNACDRRGRSWVSAATPGAAPALLVEAPSVREPMALPVAPTTQQQSAAEHADGDSEDRDDRVGEVLEAGGADVPCDLREADEPQRRGRAARSRAGTRRVAAWRRGGATPTSPRVSSPGRR